jgi:hypothetical protein
MLTTYEQSRLAEIRAALEKYRALGVDVSTWEAEFFMGIIDKFADRRPGSDSIKRAVR